MEIGKLKIGDRVETDYYGIGIIVDWDKVPEEYKAQYEKNQWIWAEMEEGEIKFIGFTFYHSCRLLSKAIDENIPRNNDGRAECFWCGTPTELRGGGNYNLCPKCLN